MTMITPSYLGETIEYSSLHACRSTLEDPTLLFMSISGLLALPLILFARFLVAKAQAENLWKRPVPRVLTKRQGVPYGVAIALGGILTIIMRPFTFG